MKDGQVGHDMSDEEEVKSASDEDFLDRAFERAVSLFEEGASLGPGDLLDGREHLRAQVESLLRTARKVSFMRSDALPRVSGFTLLSEIGRGGMGAVYIARQDSLGGRMVALKVLLVSAGLSHSARQRFLAEARAIATLRHTNVVTVHDVIAEEAVCAYAMEWIDGASLAQVIDFLRVRGERDSVEPTSADVREALGAEPAGADEPYPILICRIAIAIARALAALHRVGLVHRDVKPSNILLRRDGTPLLSDFGLVHVVDGKLTQTGQFVGTLAYASPEQLGGDPESLDVSSDVYSLGITLYHALTLHLPFDARRTRRASTPTGMLRLIESGRAAPPRSWNRRLPRDLETIVAKAMDVERAQRYASADELADDLERLLALQPIRGRRAGLVSRTAKLVRRNRAAALGLTAGSVLSLALAAAAVVYLFFVPRWVDEHVREARLALLDPSYANALFNSELFGTAVHGDSRFLSPAGLAQALESYDAALRWAPFDDAIRKERDVVAHAAGRSDSHLAESDERSAGLSAYLRGDIDAALESWATWERRRDPRAAADPLIETLIGVVHLVRDESARAYPRLREACRVFPNVGFLTTYLADAAVRCGDFEPAESLLAVARDMPRLDPAGAFERVTADLYAATGRDEEAEELFRRAGPHTPLALHYARFLGRRGLVEEALDRYVEVCTVLRGPAVKRECAAALERWWASQSSAQRLQHVSAALDLDPAAPRSLVARLRLYRATQSPIQPREHFGDFATLRVGSPSPPLQSVGLADLADILEVENMTHWSRIPSYPPFLKKLQLWGWRLRLPTFMLHAIGDMRRTMAPVAIGTLALAAAPTVCAQSFQGIGDLPGGAFESYALSISADGTTTVGQSVTANGMEAFRWRDGTLVALDDLPGGAVASLAYRCNFNGSVIVGQGTDATTGRGVRWDGTTLTQLPQPAGFGGYCIANGISSDDGSVITGYAYDGEPFSYTQRTAFRIVGGVITALPFPGPGGTSNSLGAGRPSGNGRVLGGEVVDPSYNVHASYWTDTTLTILPTLSGGADFSWALAVSEDGTVQVGGSSSTLVPPAGTGEPCRWQNDVPLGLGTVPGGSGLGLALSCNHDGSIVVGFTSAAAGSRAFIWDAQNGMRELSLVLTNDYGLNLTGWTLTRAREITPDGSVIVGDGLNPNGDIEGWIARLACSTVATYCTATPNSTGAPADLSLSGSTSSTAGDLTLRAEPVPNQFGIFFHAMNPAQLSFGNGYLCATGDIKRGAVIFTSGNVGTYVYDNSDPKHSLGAYVGSMRNFQFWFRDPMGGGAFFNLSNAISFTVCP